MYNPLTLAFLGDGVYELLVRNALIRDHGSLPASKLHSLTVQLVRASAQAQVYDTIYETVSQQEQDILRRGRNSSSTKCPKNADPAEYRKATGVEALFGYLYLKRDEERIRELFCQVYHDILKADQLQAVKPKPKKI